MDLRLQADAFGLISFLGEAVTSKDTIMSCARSARMPLGGVVLDGGPEAAWESVIGEADRTGFFDRLLQEFEGRWRDDLRLPMLQAWIKSTGVKELVSARQNILRFYDGLIGQADPRELEPQVEGLSSELVSLTRSLADTHRAREGFGGASDADRLVRRARDLVRHASAAVDSLLYQVREVVAFMDRPSTSANDRSATDRTIGGFALVDYLMRQRAAADQSVSALLDVLVGLGRVS